jgi:hypothetical protein
MKKSALFTVLALTRAQSASAFATYFLRERVGRILRLALAIRSSSGSLIEFTICREAPLSCDLALSPRLAANAAPAAICCFFDFAGMTLPSFPGRPLPGSTRTNADLARWLLIGNCSGRKNKGVSACENSSLL